MLYFVLSAVVALSLAFSDTDKGFQEESNTKLVDCAGKFAGNGRGKIFLEFGRHCEVYGIHLELGNATSILSLKIAVEHLGVETLPNPNGTLLEPGKSVPRTELRAVDSGKRGAEVKIYEETVYEDSKTDSILLANWKLQDVDEKNDILSNRSYLSRTSDVDVRVVIEGDWSNYRIIFFYEEIKYDELEEIHSAGSGEIKSGNSFEDHYQPNAVVLYRLTEVPLSSWNGILLTFEQFDIDTAAGEYVLIGAGTQPFKGPKPLLVYQPQPNSTYYVDDSIVYVIFASSSTQTRRSGFRIRWEHTGTRIHDEDVIPEDPLDALKSRDVCFYNVSSEECRTGNENGLFDRFRNLFVEIVKSYADEKKISYTDTFKSLNASSVVLHGIENCLNIFPLHAVIQVKYHGKSLLTWQQLGDVIDSFQENFPDYYVGHCPKTSVYDNKIWGFVIYLSVPVFALFFLVLWAWKQNVFKESCKTQKDDKELFVREPCMSAEPNLYDVTGVVFPTVVETNEHGRRRTLVAQNSAPANMEGNTGASTIPKWLESYDQGTRRTLVGQISAPISANEDRSEIYVNDVAPSPSSESGSSRHISLSRSKRRPSIQPLIDKNEDRNQQSHSGKIQLYEKEHLVNSLDSSDSVNDTKL